MCPVLLRLPCLAVRALPREARRARGVRGLLRRLGAAAADGGGASAVRGVWGPHRVSAVPAAADALHGRSVSSSHFLSFISASSLHFSF